MNRTRVAPVWTASLLLASLTLFIAPVQAQDILTLDDALRLARERNYDIQVAQNNTRIARADFSAGNAGFLPTLDATAGYNGTLSNTKQSFLSGQTNEVDGALTTRSSAGVDLRWTLFDGLGRNAALDRLRTEFEQQQNSARNTVEDVIQEVTLSYFELVRQQEQRVVLQEAVTISEERLRIAELRRDLGSASELEVRQARFDLNTDRVNILRQETTLINAKSNFNQLLVRPLDLDYTVQDTIPVDPVDPVEALYERALERNTLLQIAEQERAIAAILIRENRADWLPTIDANAGYAYSDLTAESGFLLSNQGTDFTYGLTLNLGLFDGFNRRRRVENATVRLRNAELVIENIRTQLQSNVSRAYQIFLNSQQTVAIEQENVTLARLNVATALERFELGTITSVELREVQETLTQAQSLLLFAQFEAKQAEIELLRLTGRLTG